MDEVVGRRLASSCARARSCRSTASSTSGEALVDESSMTGEPLPVVRERGGATSAAARATPATSSSCARSGRRPRAPTPRSSGSCRTPSRSKAPFVRLADRYAIVFLPVTIVVAGLAWALSGDPVRALAVFVVATPCPLILAAPIAFVCRDLTGREGGRDRQGRRRDRAARPGAHGAPRQDGHAHARDPRGRARRSPPTGSARTSSCGWPRRSTSSRRIRWPRRSSTRRPAGASTLSFPEQVTEEPGRGIAGVVDGRRVAAGSATWLRAQRLRARRAARDRRRRARAGDDRGRAWTAVPRARS